MDQDKFDHHLMDYLFDELDEVTRAAMKRKIEADAECRELEARLRATIEVGQLPIEEPGEDLEKRILEACEQARDVEPVRAKIVRMLSWAGSKAMDPRLAMAAILMLVIGSAILLLPAKPGSVAVTPTKEPGPGPAEPVAPNADEAAVPEAEDSEAAAEANPVAKAAPSEAKPDKQEIAALKERYKSGLENMQSGNFGEAQRDFSAVNSVPSHPDAARAALGEAQAVRAKDGCKEALSYYERARAHTSVANDAAWEQADCYAHLGNISEARKIWQALSDDKDFGQRATAELQNRGQVGGSGKNAVAAPKRAASRPPQAAPPPGGGSSGKAKAAPNEAYDQEQAY